MKSHATVQRWIGQMNLVIRNPNQTLLVIAFNGYGTKEARYIAGGRRVWRNLTTLDEMRIRMAADPTTVPAALRGNSAS